MRYFVLDTETIGFAPPETGGGVCEISVREVRDVNGAIEEVSDYHSLIDPEAPISASASGVHGIRDADVVDSPTMNEWLESVLPWNIWCAEAEPFEFIAHNASFDYKFLKPYVHCPVQIADSLALARRFYKDAENHKLSTLAVALDLRSFSAHNAHGAAADTAVLLDLMRRLVQDSGLSLHELCEESRVKEPLTKIPFGKYKGTEFSKLKTMDPQYVRWLLNKVENLDERVREALTC